MSSFKAIARDCCPPVMHRWLRRLGGGDIRFEGEFATWEEACAHCTGYDSEDILAKVLAATLQVKQGTAAFERDSVLFDENEYAWPVVAGLLGVAARNGGRLSVLDFGGSLGSSYFQSRELLKTLSTVQWNVVEQPHYVKAGQTYIQDERLHFYASIQECLTENKVNVILLSSVLQYLPDSASVFRSLLAVGADAMILDRTIINHSTSDRIYVQQVPSSIYAASYPCRSLSESRLLATTSDRYRLEADFSSLPFPALESIESEFKGYLLTRMIQ
jgi:putative methyltransferase (TIGR04325 family)